MRVSKIENPVPIWERTTLSMAEASQYTKIGINKLYELTEKEDCDFALWVGSRRLIKRKKIEEFIGRTFSL